MLSLTTGHATAACAGTTPTIATSIKSLYVIWRATNVTLERFIFGIYRGTGSFQRSVGLVVTGGNVIARYFDGSNDDWAATAVTTNAWHKTLLTQDGAVNADKLYVDSTTATTFDSPGSHSTSLATPIFSLGYVDASGSPVYTDPNGFDLAHAYYWSVVLSSGDRTSLMGGTNPSGIDTGNRVQGYSLISNGNEIGGGTTLTTSGSTTFDATDPLSVVAVAGAGVIEPLQQRIMTGFAA